MSRVDLNAVFMWWQQSVESRQFASAKKNFEKAERQSFFFSPSAVKVFQLFYTQRK
jgi:hypothetical protein